MASSDLIEMEGTIIEAHRGGMFKVEVEPMSDSDDEMIVVCKPSGKMRVNKINLVTGDRVLIQVSPYDFTKGRIVRRTE